jgi:hypothetical protein
MTDSATVFSAIADFVKSLDESFPSTDKKNPLHLYSKMIDIINKEKDEVLKKASYEKAIGGFRKYFTSSGINSINYGTSSNVYIPIARFLKSDSSTREVINSHLNNIRSLLGITGTGNASGSGTGGGEDLAGVFKDALGEDANTEDGRALQRVAEKLSSVVQNMGTDIQADPISAIGSLMADNSLEEVMNLFQSGKNNKLMRKLFTSILDKALPDDGPSTESTSGSGSGSVLAIENSPTVVGVEEVQPTSVTEVEDEGSSMKAEVGSDS